MMLSAFFVGDKSKGPHFQIMLRAIIFDFNGILSDDEHIHEEAFCRILTEEGLPLTNPEYQADYLGRDDRDCFRMALGRAGRVLDDPDLRALIARKSKAYLELVRHRVRLFPGVPEFLESVSRLYPLAIASGAWKAEVEYVLQQTGIGCYFEAVVTSDDVKAGKPAPEIFLEALHRIQRRMPANEPLTPGQCLVVEDSAAGIEAALAAGMKCLAISNSHPPATLARAHRVEASLQFNSALLRGWFDDKE
jgi:HAD superfamily hydrolase (TIGR01509 family)